MGNPRYRKVDYTVLLKAGYISIGLVHSRYQVEYIILNIFKVCYCLGYKVWQSSVSLESRTSFKNCTS